MDRLIHDTGHEDVKVSLQQIPEWIEIEKEDAEDARKERRFSTEQLEQLKYSQTLG